MIWGSKDHIRKVGGIVNIAACFSSKFLSALDRYAFKNYVLGFFCSFTFYEHFFLHNNESTPLSNHSCITKLNAFSFSHFLNGFKNEMKLVFRITILLSAE